MSNFPDLEGLAHQKWPEFETRLAELLYPWSEYDVAPVDLESEVGAFALRVAHEAQDEDLPPKMPPVETPDNSTALFGAVFLGGRCTGRRSLADSDWISTVDSSGSYSRRSSCVGFHPDGVDD